MLNKNKSFKFMLYILAVLAVVLMLIFPDICKNGINKGVLICSNVIIPSLFPFMVCVLIIMKLNITPNGKIFSAVIYKIFGQTNEMFFTMIFSMIGGYPTGCKLINELYIQNKIDKKTAEYMQLYCVNAGPAFIISAVGSGILKSKEIGFILFSAHIIATFVIAISISHFTRKRIKTEKIKNNNKSNFLSISDIFVSSTADASKSMLSICSFIILFSVINSYLVYFSRNNSILKNIVYFVEITFGITKTNNILFISFLLGFSGISIWFQLMAISKDVKIKLKPFCFARIIHGLISSAITGFLLKTFKITVQTIKNNVVTKIYYNNLTFSVSLAIMLVIWIISLYSEKSSSKIMDNVI